MVDPINKSVNTDRDELIAEALDIPCHDWQYIKETKLNQYSELKKMNSDKAFCRHSACQYSFNQRDGDPIYVPSLPSNPNFSTFAGLGLVLQKGPDREWWDDFMRYLAKQGLGKMGVLGDFLSLYLLQDPDRLANEFYAFLKSVCTCCGDTSTAIATCPLHMGKDL